MDNLVYQEAQERPELMDVQDPQDHPEPQDNVEAQEPPVLPVCLDSVA